MIFWALIIIALLILIIAFIAGIIEREPSIIPLLSLFAIIPIIPIIVSVSIHVDDIAKINNGDEYIRVTQDALLQIEEQLQIYPSGSALMNADTPIKSLIEAKAEFVKDIANRRVIILDAKSNVDARSIGLMSPVITFYGTYDK